MTKHDYNYHFEAIMPTIITFCLMVLYFILVTEVHVLFIFLYLTIKT